jgi:hypothetical protein
VSEEESEELMAFGDKKVGPSRVGKVGKASHLGEIDSTGGRTSEGTMALRECHKRVTIVSK